MHRSCSVSKRKAEHKKPRMTVDSHTQCCSGGVCDSYRRRWMFKSGRSQRRQTGLSSKVRFISSSHTLNVVNDLPHDNCTNKPFWPHMPVSVRAVEANLNTGPHRPVCLLRIVAPCQWELRGMRAGLTVHAHVHTLEWNVYTDWGFRTVKATPPSSHIFLSLRPQGSEREGGTVERQPALVLVSDFDSHQLVFFRKHLLGHRPHQRKSSPTSLPVGMVKVTVQLRGRRWRVEEDGASFKAHVECLQCHQQLTF